MRRLEGDMSLRSGAGTALLAMVALASVAGVTTRSSQGTPAATGAGHLLAAVQDPAGQSGDYFGAPIAMTTTLALVGTSGTQASNGGAAYLFGSTNGLWSTTPVSAWTDPVATGGDMFGAGVTLAGTSAAVGAYGTGSYSGLVYLYVDSGSGWPRAPTVTLQNPSAGRACFGNALAMSSAWLAVGAPCANSDDGSVYLFRHSRAGWGTAPAATLTPPLAGGLFGEAVAISGSTIIVGAPRTNADAGSAYVYQAVNGKWPTSPTDVLDDPTTTAGDYFGESVSASPDTLAVGAPACCGPTPGSQAHDVYLYRGGPGSWPTTPTTNLTDAATPDDHFGFGIALSGSHLLIGTLTAPWVDLYRETSGVWPTASAATLSHGVAGADAFGVAVGVAGNTAFVGANQANNASGAVYLYRL